MFNSQYALPRIFIRLWGARKCCASVAPVPRYFPQSRTKIRSVHDRGLVTHKAWTRIGCVREQSAVAFSPRQSPRQGTVHEQAAATNTANPPAGRRHGLSMTTIRPCPSIVRDSRLAGECPCHCNLFPFHGQPAVWPNPKSFPSYALI